MIEERKTRKIREIKKNKIQSMSECLVSRKGSHTRNKGTRFKITACNVFTRRINVSAFIPLFFLGNREVEERG